MEPQTKRTAPQAASRPVMDVKPRQNSPAPITAPVEPPAEEPDANADKISAEKPASKDAKPPKPAKVKTPNVTLAIVATVIIVLGLGLLATYAYMKQNS